MRPPVTAVGPMAKAWITPTTSTSSPPSPSLSDRGILPPFETPHPRTAPRHVPETSHSIPKSPKATYTGLMLAVSLAAIAAAAGIARSMGGDGRTTTLAAAAVAIGSVATFLPILLGRRSKDAGAGMGNFGVLVLVASVTRTLLILSAALLFDQTRQLVRPALWIGAMGGAVIVLVAESAVAIALLSRLERLKTSQRPAPTAPQR